MKAVLITKTNQAKLASRYFLDAIDYDDKMPIGYYLVCGFGDEDNYELLTLASLDAAFTYDPLVTLENEFFEVNRR
jgi:hypothetical protein